jgi:hypothetical protein
LITTTHQFEEKIEALERQLESVREECEKKLEDQVVEFMIRPMRKALSVAATLQLSYARNTSPIFSQLSIHLRSRRRSTQWHL